MIGHDAITFLGHPPVEGPEPRFEVRHLQAVLSRCERTAERRIGVPVHQHPVGPLLAEDRIQPGQDPGGLDGVASRADAEVHRRRPDGEVVEECPGQQPVVVLARVHYHVLMPELAERMVHRRELDELRPSTDHAQYPHALPSQCRLQGQGHRL